MIIKNKFGTITLFRPAFYFDKKIVGISMSGGVDSSLLCFLAAKAINKENLEISIQPYNGFDSWAPNDSLKIPNIVAFIRKRFPDVDLKDPIMEHFDTKGDQIYDKNYYIRPFVKKLRKQRKIDLVMSGISMGPPINVQKKFTQPRIYRRRGTELWNEVEAPSPHLAPYKSIDKRFIIQCYVNFKIEPLLDLTHSCTHPTEQKCGQCWWCQEKAWAMNEVFK